MSICCLMYQNITFKQGIYRINDNILSWICFAKSNCINSKNFFLCVTSNLILISVSFNLLSCTAGSPPLTAKTVTCLFSPKTPDPKSKRPRECNVEDEKNQNCHLSIIFVDYNYYNSPSFRLWLQVAGASRRMGAFGPRTSALGPRRRRICSKWQMHQNSAQIISPLVRYQLRGQCLLAGSSGHQKQNILKFS